MNKGFTLVELLATIVILALIMAIAVPSISSISKTIKEKQREHLIEKIEIAASKYAFDTGETVVFVETLLQEGYLESDEEQDGILILKDPLSSKILNCYAVETKKEKDYYSSKFIDKNYQEVYEDDEWYCDLGLWKQEESCIYFTVNGEIVYPGEGIDWQKGEVNLVAENECGIDCNLDKYKCEWTSNTGAYISGKQEITLNNKLLNTKYTFQATDLGEADDELFYRDIASIYLKIDNEAPVIYENEIKVTDKFIYTDTKKVTISASDGKGSGVAGYYLDLDNGQSCDNVELQYQDSKTFTIDNNGTYLICVKDDVGNTSKSSLTINYIS